MKKMLSNLVILGSLLISASGFAKEPTNLVVHKQELTQYHDSGEYEKDINRVISSAIDYLKVRVAHEDFDGKKPAIVLDIDETSLSNYPDMVKMGFGGTLKQIVEAADKGLNPAIQPTLKLYNFAKANHIAVFFVTGRREFEREVTAANLQNAGYSHWDALILRSHAFDHAPASEYKIAMRKRITEQGFKIIANIGDQLSDLRGGYADQSFKLPGPFYIIP